MNVSGVALCARFSIATNRLRYCGPDGADAVLADAIRRGESLEASAALLRRFEALEPYLEAIARASGREPFDEAVVEAYWIGNELLDGVTRADFAGILRALRARGLPPSAAARLEANLPERPLPHHAFHVAYVGVGAVTGKVATTIETMDRCRPSWARILDVGAETLRVEVTPLGGRDRRLSLGQPVPSTLAYDPTFLPGVVPGDVVAGHWGWAAHALDGDQSSRLRTYTDRCLEAASEGLTSSGGL